MPHALITLVAIFLAAGSAGAQAPEDMDKRLAACGACHGPAGEGREGNEYYPHLAGKPAGYLAAQLRAFRDGRRVYTPMNWLMRNMGDTYLDWIASYYAEMPPRSSAVAVPMTAEDERRAQQLVQHGDADRGVPACAACHGADLAGLEPGVPALLGLPPDYVTAQLGAWRTGSRKAVIPDCMADIARRLAPSDFRRLGNWLATQGAKGSMKPAPAGSFALPVACGDLPVEQGRE